VSKRVVAVRLAGLAALVALVGPSWSHAAFPGSNGKIAFVSEGAIYVVNPDGTGLAQLTSTSSDDITVGESWSGDGQWLAFSAYRGTDPDIYVIRADGSGRRQVTFSRGVDVDPSFSPHRDRIAFETNRNGGQFDIYSVDAVGRNPLRLTNGPENELDPTYSPDGKHIAYTVESVDHKSRQVWVMAADGSGKTQLTNAPNFSENPNWSPDGKRIAFDSDRAELGNLEIYSMAADGSDVVQLTNHPALDALPAYSPDGKQIVFVSDRLAKDSRRLFVMPANGGAAKRVIAADSPNHQMVPDWQPQRTGVVERAEAPPGRPLGVRGANDRVDPLFDRGDAWAVKLHAGITYRVNLYVPRGCAAVTLYAAGTRSFASGRQLAGQRCGGYFTFTPGPSGTGTYSLLVTPSGAGEAAVRYHLQVAPAGPDDQGPGVLLPNHTTRSGRVSARGIDVVDLYRFDIARRSVVRLGFSGSPSISLVLSKLGGGSFGTAAGSTSHVLTRGTYLVKVSAAARGGGSYRLGLLARVVTKTAVKANGKRSVTVRLGQSVALDTTTAPAPGGGTTRLRLDYDDPLSGWVFRHVWKVVPGSGVAFTPPAVGLWRITASFSGTRDSSPSGSRVVLVRVLSTGA
jgi:TolB protein